MLDNKGFSLFELIVVTVIMIILLAIAVPMMAKYIKAYTVQKEINQIYSDLMQERVRAVETGVPRGIVFNSSTSYTLFVFNDKNRNLQFDGASEELNPVNKTLSIPLDGPSNGTVILFDDRGMSKTSNWALGNFTIYINYPTRYNCLVVSVGRIRKGVWNGSACEPR